MPEPVAPANTPEKSTDNIQNTCQLGNQNVRCRVHSTKGPQYHIKWWIFCSQENNVVYKYIKKKFKMAASKWKH